MKLMYTISSVLFLLVQTAFFQPSGHEKAKMYIDKYKAIAISEMQRTGIPASIKLAQGMLESSWGGSELAKTANNHFGIKCGNSWTGGTYYVYDDDYKNGEKIKSCFRAFGSAEESYIAHSEFLSNPKKERYALLFYFPPNDYKSWAYGLKDAGYATDSKYPQKLISIIEQYELYKFDSDDQNKIYTLDDDQDQAMPSYDLEETAPSRKKIVSSETTQEPMMITEQRGREKSPLFSKNKTNNSTARKRPSQGLSDANTQAEDTSRRVSSAEYHIVQHNESMQDVAKMYGVPTLLLYSKNRMPLGTQPLNGERLQLKGTVRIGDRPKFEYRDKKSNSEFVF